MGTCVRPYAAIAPDGTDACDLVRNRHEVVTKRYWSAPRSHSGQNPTRSARSARPVGVLVAKTQRPSSPQPTPSAGSQPGPVTSRAADVDLTVACGWSNASRGPPRCRVADKQSAARRLSLPLRGAPPPGPRGREGARGDRTGGLARWGGGRA